MIHALQHPRCPNDAPAIVKHCVRFGRRLRAHGIYTAEFPALVDDTKRGATILVGGRVIHINDDGSYTQQLKPVRIGDVWRFDRQGMQAFRARSHARFLGCAAVDRGRRWGSSARAMLAIATHDRVAHSREAMR
jgi:hypothetical protein